MIDPISHFQNLFNQHLQECRLSIPHACCFSTIGLDGYPNSRFVSLKEVIDEGFVITGSLDSLKGKEVKNNNKVALSFWLESISYQIRIQGEAQQIGKDLANKYFYERSKESQLVTLISKQGQTIDNYSSLLKELDKASIAYEDNIVPIPESWGGLIINPIRIEFLMFKKSRLHQRELFTKDDNKWTSSILQP
ncbi:pyridoxal 5'-phosphate synthase [Yeosuana sp. MJ-SS3]|uniref:Pyridoxal 5'-phosphate synthase n=1 Tax=Gilvirhabdus luticola TaxID=3079858 RepID=A0ABU3U3N5_9FLAO|nr:pyridoxal 5'-phosphate synthase [Yeosuana sp. MJ-SS3]MDU8885013.1 pyridoxal 5'-phosphate synthase [Yeosuana sp. MJ-SS3]